MTKLFGAQSPQSLQDLAYALAAGTPEYLGRPTIPPIVWSQDGETVIVILADGRKVSASILEINQLMFSQGIAEQPEDIEASIKEVDDLLGLLPKNEPPVVPVPTRVRQGAGKGGSKKK